jgi:hypothetical protein
MSALGQKQTLEHVRIMSASPPKADIGTQPRNVRFVLETDVETICARLHKAGGAIIEQADVMQRVSGGDQTMDFAFAAI